MPIVRFDEYMDENNDARYIDNVIVLDGPITRFNVGTRGFCDRAHRRMVPNLDGAWIVQNVIQMRYPRVAHIPGDALPFPPQAAYETVRRWTLGNEGNMAQLIVE